MKRNFKKSLNLILSIVVFILLSLTFVSCKQIDENVETETTAVTTATESPYPVEVGSLSFESAPENAVSLSPALTEIICELGYSEYIVGRSTYCDYPENISDRNAVGSSANPDVKAIVDIAPALLISQSPIAKKDIVTIEEVGTRVFIMPQPLTVEELYDNYLSIAEIFGGKTNAEQISQEAIEPLKKALSEVGSSIGSYVYIMDSHMSVAGDNTFIGNFLSHFGTNAVSPDADSIKSSELSELNPDYIFIAEPLNLEKFTEKFSDLSACQNGNVIVISRELQERMERPTSRLSLVVDELLKMINSNS